MRLACLILFFASQGLAQAAARPLLSMLSTCAQLTPSFYPADTTTWFDSARNPQVVFFAHMLFPLKPELDGLEPGQLDGAWHPPLVAPAYATPTAQAASILVADAYYAEAQWLDPDDKEVARFGLTMSARVSGDYIHLGTREYIPHTFAMTLGTKDIRAQAGQEQVLSKNGQYHIRLYVDGQLEGISFFRMLGNAPSPSPALSPGAEAAFLERSRTAESLPGSGGNLIQDVLKLMTQTAK